MDKVGKIQKMKEDVDENGQSKEFEEYSKEKWNIKKKCGGNNLKRDGHCKESEKC